MSKIPTLEEQIAWLEEIYANADTVWKLRWVDHVNAILASLRRLADAEFALVPRNALDRAIHACYYDHQISKDETALTAGRELQATLRCKSCDGKGWYYEGEAITGRGPDDVFPEKVRCPDCSKDLS